MKYVILKIKHFFGYHDWKYFSEKDEGYRKCKICGLTQQEVWDDFASFYWCPVGWNKQMLIDRLSSGE